MISIQELTKRTGVSSRMLRYYDEKGLLTPAYRTDSGTRYYDESAEGILKLIATFLFLDYSVDDTRAMLVSGEFDPHTAAELLKRQSAELELRRAKIDESLAIINGLTESEIASAGSWSDIASTIRRNIYDKHIVDTHSTGQGRFKNNFWRKAGSEIGEWLRFMFEPVRFDRDPINMCEVNASVLDFWKYNANRLPTGRLDLFYDSAVRIGTERLGKQGLWDQWHDVRELSQVPDESYDMIFNDHLFFYGERLDAGLREMYRILKRGGRFYCTVEDAGHNSPLRQLTHYVLPSRDFVTQWQHEHYGLESLLQRFNSEYSVVNDYPRFNDVTITDENFLMQQITDKANISAGDTAARQRLESVKRDVHAQFVKEGKFVNASRYHMIECIK